MKRIYHTWDEWECFPSGFYNEKSPVDGEERVDTARRYADFLRDSERFRAACKRVITEWKNSCEHYLSNESMNRIAWMGQAAACISEGIPSNFRTGFHLLSKEEQQKADEIAFQAINEWMVSVGETPLTSHAEAGSNAKVDLY